MDEDPGANSVYEEQGSMMNDAPEPKLYMVIL